MCTAATGRGSWSTCTGSDRSRRCARPRLGGQLVADPPERHAAEVPLAAAAHRDLAGIDLTVADDEDDRHAQVLRLGDLLPDRLVAKVGLGAKPGLGQLPGHLDSPL